MAKGKAAATAGDKAADKAGDEAADEAGDRAESNAWSKAWNKVRALGSYLDKHRETGANAVIVLTVIACAVLAWTQEPIVRAATRFAPEKLSCPHTIGTGKVQSKSKVSNPSGANATLNIFIGPDGDDEARNSSPLVIETGKLTPGPALCTFTSDFVRSDGQILPAGQVTSHAEVSKDGRYVIVTVAVAPRYNQVSGFGEYFGTVSLDDPRAAGANVPVRIYVEYPYINRVLLCGLLAAAFGLAWALIVRMADIHTHANGTDQQTGLFWTSLALRVAVLATALPVLNVQVLSNPSWTGSPSQYIKLGTVAGAAAIATTPTLSAIVSRVKVRTPPSGQSNGTGKPANGANGADALPANTTSESAAKSRGVADGRVGAASTGDRTG